MDEPREPIFYPNKKGFCIDVSSDIGKTLQSIDSTLKRIEKILIERQDEEEDAVEKAFLIAAQEIKQRLPKD